MSESKVPQIVAVGELLWDLLPGGARLGGAPANFAVFCARLGNRSVLVSSLGNDGYGGAARSLLVQPNLDLTQLQMSEAYPTGTVEVTFSADNQPSYLISRGVAWDFIQLTPGLLATVHAADAICFETLPQRHEVSRSTIRSLVEGAPAACVRVCDINIRMPDCSSRCPRVVGRSREHHQGKRGGVAADLFVSGWAWLVQRAADAGNSGPLAAWSVSLIARWWLSPWEPKEA